MEVMAKRAYANPNPKWAEHGILPPSQSSSLPLVVRKARWGSETADLGGSASLQGVRYWLTELPAFTPTSNGSAWCNPWAWWWPQQCSAN